MFADLWKSQFAASENTVRTSFYYSLNNLCHESWFCSWLFNFKCRISIILKC